MTPEEFDAWMTQVANLCISTSLFLAFALVIYIASAIIPFYIIVPLLIVGWFTKGVK